ncbi:MAG TPA: hypothetical protein VH479_10370 [Acidimicrobiales bacterium]
MRTRAWAGAAMVVACMGSAGCWWTQPGGSPGQTFSTYDPYLTVDNVASLQKTWSGRGGMSAVFDGTVVGAYWTGSGVDVVAHDLDSGTETWSRTLTPPGAISGLPSHAPVVTGTSVWAGYQARTAAGTCVFGFERLDLATGSVLGADSTRAPVELVPFGDDVALITTTYTPGIPDTCIPSGTNLPGVADGATGTMEWTGTSGAQAITVAGDTLLTTAGPVLRSYPTAGCGAPSCPAIWQSQPAGVGALNDLAGEATPLFAIAPSGGQLRLHAISAAVGNSLASTLLPFNASSLAVDGSAVIVAGQSSLAVYDAGLCAAGACTPAWTASLGGQATFANGLAVAGGVIYVGRDDGVVEAFPRAGCGAATCSALTSVSTGATVLQLAVAQGHLLVGSLDGVTVFAPTA